jgi:hypothetical protein
MKTQTRIAARQKRDERWRTREDRPIDWAALEQERKQREQQQGAKQ